MSDPPNICRPRQKNRLRMLSKEMNIAEYSHVSPTRRKYKHIHKNHIIPDSRPENQGIKALALHKHIYRSSGTERPETPKSRSFHDCIAATNSVL